MLLEGLKVVEWATWVAGPGCAAVMADWGAEVTKVESAAGDVTRALHYDGSDPAGGPIFFMENRGKRGVVLDVATPQGRKAMLALLATADVFVTNVRPGGLKRVGLDYDSLKAEFPRLIFASITGYGLTGPQADLPAFDITGFWTRGGVAASTIPPDQEPFPCRPGFGDHMTAMSTLAGVLAAVHERGRTGRGRLVETSLIRMGAYAMGWDLSLQLRYGAVETARPRDERPVATSGYFRTADDRWFCMIPRGAVDFPTLLRAIGRPQYAEDPRCTPPILDLAVVREVRAVLDAAFARMTLEEVRTTLDAVDLVWAPMATLAELEMDPQAHEAGCFVEQPDGKGGSFWAPANPVRFPGLDTGPAGPPPRLGEHGREVLREAGLSEAEIDAALA